MQRSEVRQLIETLMTEEGTGRKYLFGRPENDAIVGMAVSPEDEAGEHKLVVMVETWDAPTSALIDEIEQRVGEEVVVEETGTFTLESRVDVDARIRPLAPGCSIGVSGSTSVGSLGGFVVTSDGKVAILSNAHVLDPALTQAVGVQVCQPGAQDGADAVVASVSVALPVRTDVTDPIDAALATLDDGVEFTGDAQSHAVPLPMGDSAVNTREVYKTGRTTGTTTGSIVGVDAVVSGVNYPTGVVSLTGMILVRGANGERFTEGGDSGSVVRDRQTQRPVGLHVAGSPTSSVCHPLDVVLHALDATLLDMPIP